MLKSTTTTKLCSNCLKDIVNINSLQHIHTWCNICNISRISRVELQVRGTSHNHTLTITEQNNKSTWYFLFSFII